MSITNYDYELSPDDQMHTADRSSQENPAQCKLSGVLRKVATFALLFSAVSFLIQGASSAVSSTERLIYFMLMTFALLGSGFICIALLKEAKGARTALGIGINLIPLYLLQVGAVLLTFFPGELQSYYPRLLKFNAIGDSLLLLIIAASVIVLTVLARFIYRVLSSADSQLFFYTALLGWVSILMPTRNVYMIGLMVAGLIAVYVYLDKQYFLKDKYHNTLESIVSQFSVLLPIILLLMRNMTLYPNVEIVIITLLTVVAITTHLVMPRVNKKTLCVIINIFSLFLAASLFINNYFGKFIVEYHFYLIGLLLALYQLRYSYINKNDHRLHVILAATIITIASFLQIFYFGGVLDSVVVLITAIFVGIQAYKNQHKLLFISNILLFFVSTVRHFELVLELYSYSSWIFMGTIGIILIIASSLVEKNAGKIQVKFQEIKSW